MSIEVHRRTARRAIVAGMYGSWALMLAVWWMAARDKSPGWMALAVVAAICFGVSFYWLRQSARPYGDPFGDRRTDLDERQMAVLQSATAKAYTILGGAVVVSAAYAWIVQVIAPKVILWLPSGKDQWEAVLWTSIILATSLPYSVLAWQEPDELPFEERASE